VGVAKVLVRIDTEILERFVVTVAERAGHSATGVPRSFTGQPCADVVLVEATAATHEWLTALRERGVAIVLIGGDPRSPGLQRLHPITHVPVPFAVAELEQAIADAVRAP
jgi:hypothetical protein